MARTYTYRAGLLCALLLCGTATAAAQDEESEGSAEAGAAAEGTAEKPSLFDQGEKTPAPAAKPAGPRDWSFGPYFRFVVVPSFMLKLFLDEAPTPTNVGFGASASYRSKEGGPIFDLGLGYTGYGFDGPFRTKGGDLNDTEIVNSNLGFVHLTGSMLWETPVGTDQLTFQYGIGLDLGVVTGSMKRTEAYPVAGGYEKCMGPGVPAPLYCQSPLTVPPGPGATDPYNVKGEQYNVKEKSIPPVMAFPMLPRLGLRYAPIPDFWLRLDMAYGIAQFWFGLSAAYSPET